MLGLNDNALLFVTTSSYKCYILLDYTKMCIGRKKSQPSKAVRVAKAVNAKMLQSWFCKQSWFWKLTKASKHWYLSCLSFLSLEAY